MYSWGNCQQGQLGQGKESLFDAEQKQISDLEDVALSQINAFADKTAAITDQGDLLFWGRSINGSYVSPEGHPFKTNLVSPYLFDYQGVKFQHVACGRNHMVAVTQDGKVLALGNPDQGQLGIQQYVDEIVAQRSVEGGTYKPSAVSDRAMMGYVVLPEGQKAKQASCGFEHTACITESGDLYVWGDGRQGQLGLGDQKRNADLPQKVELPAKASKVLCGAKFTMVLCENKKLYAFGDNRYGQLGVSGSESIVITTPAEVSTLFRKVKDFDCGEEHAAYVDDKGVAYTWGCGL